MNKIATIDEIEWINKYLKHLRPINQKQVDSILYFTFIWNLFEGQMCDQNASITKLEQVANQLHRKGRLATIDVGPQLAHFSSRYITNGRANLIFNRLQFRPNDRRTLVERVLNGTEQDPARVLLALLIIVYRLRNNLFHGVKSLYSIRGQAANFGSANRLLMQLLEAA